MSRSAPRLLLVSVLVALGAVAAPIAADRAQAKPASPSSDVVGAWNRLALDAVRHNSASDANAARLYAMVNAAMYDAVNGLEPPEARRQAALVSAPPDDLPGDPRLAAAAAAHEVLSALYPSDAAAYDAQLATDVGSVGSAGRAKHSRSWGEQVGEAIVAARAHDGATPVEIQPAAFEIGQFSSPWSGSQFRNLAPFAIDNSSVYVGSGPPALGSAEYASAFNEVKAVGDARVPDDASLATYRFWSLGNGSVQPPGAWVQVALDVVSQRALSLNDQARLFALETIAMADTVAPTFATKYIHHSWRPQRAIQLADDDGNDNTTADTAWRPRAGSAGSSPEHWSGHSSFSASAARVLTAFFCNDAVAFTLKTDAPNTETRTFTSFSSASTQAGRSRVVGGIHFEFSNQAGLSAGRAVADEVLTTALLPASGTPDVCTV